MTTSTSKPDDYMNLSVTGHVVIRDKETKEVLLDKRS